MKNRRFLRLWAAYSASVLGDQIYFLAVPLLIFTEGGTASTMALIKSCTLLPQAAFGVFGGVIADRRDKIGVLRLAYLGSSVILLLALAGYLALPDARLPVLACAALALSAFAALSAASIDSALPHFVAPHELARANSMTETTRTVAAVAGPAAAGILVASAFPGSAILANGIAFAAAYLLLSGMHVPGKPGPKQHPAGLLKDLTEGLRYLARSRRLFTGIFLSTTTNLVLGAYEAVLIFHLRAGLGLSSAWTGAVFAVAGGVSVATAVLLAWRAPTKSYGGAMALSIVLQGVGIAIVPLGNSLPTAICGQVLLAVFTVVYTVCWRAYRQSVCEPRLLGRVSGACRAIAYAGAFTGSLLSGLVLSIVSDITVVLFASGALTVMTGAAGLLLLPRGDQTAPSPSPGTPPATTRRRRQ